MNKKTFIQKSNGDTLEASEWNELTGYVNEAVDAINTGGSGDGLPNLYINSKGNLNLETSTELGNTSKGKINIEAMSDIQLKPGDDIILYSHHREEGKQDEVAVKVTDGDDIPVKTQINTSEINLTTKVNSNTDGGDMNIGINCNTNKRGYLKVRAQAIDLRCEKHGGVSLQPKGFDNDGNMNKIKFEHGGGDGLEFGTFNTEKTSIFTDEYRFNKNGVWKMATREKEASGKTIRDENESGVVPAGKEWTGAYKYVKQSDDFYDIISGTDAQCTTEDIINTANAFNDGDLRNTTYESGKLNIQAGAKYLCETVSADTATDQMFYNVPTSVFVDGKYYTHSEIAELIMNDAPVDVNVITNVGLTNLDNGESFVIGGTSQASGAAEYCHKFTAVKDSITISAGNKLTLEASNEIKFVGELDFGSAFNFGETDGGISVQHKLTKKNAVKDCGVIQVLAVNNHASNNLTIDKSIYDDVTDPSNPTLDTTQATITPGNSQVVASCSIIDIIRLVNYMKYNHEGPWTVQP